MSAREIYQKGDFTSAIEALKTNYITISTLVIATKNDKFLNR